MLAPDNCALFIGVEDYSAFDASLGQPAGTSDLPGARADAIAFFEVCKDLGIPAENMRILTSPRLDPAALSLLPAACLGDATAESILEGTRWLAERLGAAGKPPGLFTYSGHGDWLEGEGLVLCPSDTTGPGLRGALPFARLQAIFDAQRAAANLTVLLDTCHAGAARAGMGRRAGSLSGRALPALLGGQIPSLGDRMVAACKAGELAWRGKFSGVSRGAFSWAVASTLEQWSPRSVGGHVELDLSYDELVDRARRLLSALSFEQTPVLHGRPGTGQTPFFHAGPGGAGDPTSADPTAVGSSGQLNPDVNYELRLSWITNEDWTVVTNSTLEQWALDSTFLNAIRAPQGAQTLTLTPGAMGTVRSTVLTNPVTSLWTRLPAGVYSGSVFQGAGATGTIALGFALSAGSPWTGDLWWFAATNTGSPPPGALVSGRTATSLTYASALPAPAAGYSWYYLKLPALTWSSAPAVLDETALGSSLASMGSTVYLASVKHDNHLHMRSSSNGTTWSARTETGVTGAHFGPAIATLEATLHLVYSDGTNLKEITSTDGVRWTSSTSTGARSSGSPALAAVVNGTTSTLCLAYQATSPTSEIQTRAWSGSTWSSASTAMTSATGAPSLAALGSSLYMAVATSTGIAVLRAQSVSGTGVTWPSTYAPIATLTPPSGQTWSEPGLSVWQGQLALSFKDRNNHVWACFSSDGVSWSGYQDLTVQISTVTTTVAPAVGALGTTLVLAFNGSSGLATLAAT